MCPGSSILKQAVTLKPSRKWVILPLRKWPKLAMNIQKNGKFCANPSGKFGHLQQLLRKTENFSTAA